MKFKIKKLLPLLLILCLLFTACSKKELVDGEKENLEQEAGKKEVPSLKIGYIYTNHQTPLMLAAKLGEELGSDGLYLKELVEKEKYILMEKDKEVANVDLVVNKSGSETMTMIAQGHIDLAIASNTAFITSRDQGNPVEILCPVHTEGIGLVVEEESPINNWEDFEKKAKDGKEQLSIGYHSPTSAPLILFQAALKESGITYTKDPSDINTPVLLMDLKGTSNLIPAMTSKQVDGWVGPSPYPELAVTEKVGKIALDMKHLPPEGKWYDFPCCVLGTTNDISSKYPEEVGKVVELLTRSANYCNENMDIAAEVTSEFTGVALEAAKLSTIKYTTNPSDAWIENMGITYETLKETDSLSNELKDKSYEDAKSHIFNFSFIKNILK